MQRRLSEFFGEETAAKVALTERTCGEDPSVNSLEYDSRKVVPGTLFFALSGLHTDGHRHVEDAVKRGARVVVHEAEIGRKDPGVVYLRVRNSRVAMSPIATAFYGFPSKRLLVIGVTGTEGKSTTVYLIWQFLRLLGKKAGFFSTVQQSDGGDERWNAEHQTTPEATVVQRLLWEMAENGCTYAVVESSSHGLSVRNNRLGDVVYDAAVFTNLRHEHMEFHETPECYRNDKANLFRALDRGEEKTGIPGTDFVVEPFGVINADDPNADYFSSVTRRDILGFSTEGMETDLTMTAIHGGSFGNWYKVQLADGSRLDIRDRLPGTFNAGNVLAALLTVSQMTGLSPEELALLCPKLLPVRGRMTAIDQKQPFRVLVDYAHTPSSFRAIFPPLRRQLDIEGGRIISLFGSPGERDTIKRREQGKIAAEYSDFIVLTDEDPRGESPMDILKEIAQGIFAQMKADPRNVSFRQGENLFLIPDRPKAIRRAFSLARPGDVVLLLGKGHENSIIYADGAMPFDEIAEAEKALRELPGRE